MSPAVTTPTTTSPTANAIDHVVAKTLPPLKYLNKGITNGAATAELSPLDAGRLTYQYTTSPGTVPVPDSPEVWASSTCTDHMIICSWTATTGWAAPELKPYGPLTLMPTASCFHYATECFEGLKVYRGYDGKLRLFRLMRNCERMLMSSIRISLPGFDPKELEKLILSLCAVDCPKWLPNDQPGEFLYIRPTMIGSAAALGVQKPKEAILFIIMAPFPKLYEMKPNEEAGAPGMKLLASREDMVRAWPGGFGYAKVGANYGPSLMAQSEAKARGYDQILWLFGKDGHVTEAGASNFFIVWKTKEGRTQLVTAPLDERLILDGVTRRSVLDLARERLTNESYGLEKLEIVERMYTMAEVEAATQDGRLVEAFAAGTAFFISPVSKIHFRGTDLQIPMAQGVTGNYAALIKRCLMDIMYGREQHEWATVVNEEA